MVTLDLLLFVQVFVQKPAAAWQEANKVLRLRE